MGIPIGACEIWFAYTVTGDNETMYTHLAYDTTDVFTQAKVDAGFTAWQTAFKSLAPPDCTLVGGHVLAGNDGGSIRWDSSIAPVLGTGTGNASPPNCAYLVKKSGELGGRRNRGRMYIPCIPEGNVTSAGLLAGSVITAVNTACAGLNVGGSVHTAFNILGFPQILHETGSQTPSKVVDLSCQQKIATQRRRLRR